MSGLAKSVNVTTKPKINHHNTYILVGQFSQLGQCLVLSTKILRSHNFFQKKSEPTILVRKVGKII
jgi:hypothetical protein